MCRRSDTVDWRRAVSQRPKACWRGDGLNTQRRDVDRPHWGIVAHAVGSSGLLFWKHQTVRACMCCSNLELLLWYSLYFYRAMNSSPRRLYSPPAAHDAIRICAMQTYHLESWLLRPSGGEPNRELVWEDTGDWRRISKNHSAPRCH